MSQKIRNIEIYLEIKQYLKDDDLIKNQHLINISSISRKFKLNYLTTRKYIKDILERRNNEN